MSGPVRGNGAELLELFGALGVPDVLLEPFAEELGFELVLEFEFAPLSPPLEFVLLELPASVPDDAGWLVVCPEVDLSLLVTLR